MNLDLLSLRQQLQCATSDGKHGTHRAVPWMPCVYGLYIRCMHSVCALYGLCMCPDTMLLCLQASDQDLDGGTLGAPQDVGPRRARGSKSDLLQGVGRQSSAVNLTKLARDSDLKHLIEEVGLHRCCNVLVRTGLIASSCLLYHTFADLHLVLLACCCCCCCCCCRCSCCCCCCCRCCCCCCCCCCCWGNQNSLAAQTQWHVIHSVCAASLF